MVICTVPIRLFGERAGDYLRGKSYDDDSLAVDQPDNFQRVIPADDPEIETPAAAGETTDEAPAAPGKIKKGRKP